MALLLLLCACSSTRTTPENEVIRHNTLELKSGDAVRVITTRRERFALTINEITRETIEGTTLQWNASSVAGGHPVSLRYEELAFVQVDKNSPGRTAGLVASVTLIGAFIVAAAAGPAPVMY